MIFYKKACCYLMNKSLFIPHIYCFLSKFIPVIPYYALFLEKSKQFNTPQVLVFFSLYGIGLMLFEIPCGIVADKYGVRFSIILGHIFRLFSILLLIYANHYIVIFFTQLILACADALLSGSEETYFFSFYRDNESVFTQRSYSFDKFTAKLHSINWFGIACSFFTGTICAYFGILFIFHL